MTTTSAALKVGDRVHVAFDGVVKALPINPVYSFVEVTFNHDDLVLDQRVVTKIADPEPEWALDDMILVGGEVFLRRRNNSHWCGYDYNANTQVCREAAWISRCWDQGDIQRLVPEAQK